MLSTYFATMATGNFRNNRLKITWWVESSIHPGSRYPRKTAQLEWCETIDRASSASFDDGIFDKSSSWAVP